MNIKTTIGLGLAVLLVATAYLLWNSARTADPQPDSTADTKTEAEQNRRLTQPPLSNDDRIVEVVYDRPDKGKLVFVRPDTDSDSDQWLLTEPVRCPATRWLVSDIILGLKRLEYITRIDLKAADAVSLEDAGMKPEPRGKFILKDEADESIEVWVGDTLLGQGHTYVYLPSRENELFVSEESFDHILDKDPLQYRERKLLDVDPTKIASFQVQQQEEGTLRNYRLVHNDDGWYFVEPFNARADSEVIRKTLGSLSRMWAKDWLQDKPENLEEFGLSDPALRYTVTVRLPEPEKPEANTTDEEQPEETPDTEQPEGAEDALRSEQHELLISNVSPADDNQQIYVKRAEDEQVGTVNLAEVEKVRPEMRLWRDMDVLPSNIMGANKVHIRLRDPEAEFMLSQHDSFWYLGTEEAPLADAPEVQLLLSILDQMKAVNFVDDPGDPAEFGLKEPLATVQIHLPNQEDIVTVHVGDFTESVEKRLRYVQRAGSPSIAKVKKEDVEPLLRQQMEYRNREILSVDASRIVKLGISRRVSQVGEEQYIELSRNNIRVWEMTDPIHHEVDLKPVNKMVSNLAELRGARIVNETNMTNVGLDYPELTVAITVEAVPVLKENPEGNNADDSVMELSFGPPEVVQIQMSRINDAVYGRRLDSPIVYEMTEAIYNSLMEEVLPGRIWQFDPEQVRRISYNDPDRTVWLQKEQDRWIYSVDPDIPLSNEKVKKYISRLHEQITTRYAVYRASNLQEYGLIDPAYRIVVELEDGTAESMILSNQICNQDSLKRVYAAKEGENGVFLVNAAYSKIAAPTLDQLEPTGE